MGIIRLLMKTWESFQKCHGPIMAAALAYSTLFAIFPLLLALIAVLGFFLASGGAAALDAQKLVLQQVRVNIPVAYETIADALDQVQRQRGALTLWALGLLIVSGSTIFGQLEYALDVMFDCSPRQRNFLESIRARVLNALVVFLVALLLIGGTLLDTVVKFLQANTAALPESGLLWSLVMPLLSLTLTTVLFALVFKFVPYHKVTWRSILPGALVGAVLWEVGKQALAWYIGRQAYTATYGPLAGAVILMVWLYYSAHILLLSAKLTATMGKREGNTE